MKQKCTKHLKVYNKLVLAIVFIFNKLNQKQKENLYFFFDFV